MFQIPLRNSGKNPGGNEQTKEAFVFRSQRKPLNLRATSLPGHGRGRRPQGPQLLCKCHNFRALFPLAIVIHRMSTPISCSRDLIIARRPKARRRENSPNAILPNSKQDVRGRSFRHNSREGVAREAKLQQGKHICPRACYLLFWPGQI